MGNSIQIRAISAHKDHCNLYTETGKRYRFQLQRGVWFNRLRASILIEYMNKHGLTFASTVLIPIGTSTSIKEFFAVIEPNFNMAVRFYLEMEGVNVVELSNKVIRMMYSPLSLGWRDKSIKQLAELGYTQMFGAKAAIDALQNSEYTTLDLALIYAANLNKWR